MTLSDQTKAEAAAWLSRLHMDSRDALDEAAFKVWLSERPENAQAFEAVTNTWDLTEGFRAADYPSPMRAPVRRRAVLAGLGTLVAAGATFGIWQTAYAGVYETDVGEQKHVSLSDGTQVFLDTNTRIRESYSSDLRRLDLERGRINVRVKPELKRPFVVQAGDQRILAPGTSFDVRRDADMLSMVLLQGEATILPSGQTQNRRLRLAAGQRLVLSDHRNAQLDKPNLVPLTAWQTGQAIFDNDTLRDAAAEMNRYTTEQIAIDPAVASLRMSGVYRVGDNEAFARSVSRLLPVAIEHYPDRIELVRDTNRTPEG